MTRKNQNPHLYHFKNANPIQLFNTQKLANMQCCRTLGFLRHLFIGDNFNVDSLLAIQDDADRKKETVKIYNETIKNNKVLYFKWAVFEKQLFILKDLVDKDPIKEDKITKKILDDARKYTKQFSIMDKRDVVAFLEDARQVAAERAKGVAEKEAKVAALKAEKAAASEGGGK